MHGTGCGFFRLLAVLPAVQDLLQAPPGTCSAETKEYERQRHLTVQTRMMSAEGASVQNEEHTGGQTTSANCQPSTDV